MTYTLYYAALLSFWPIVAFAGGQGFSVMLALACLPALPLLRPSWKSAPVIGAITVLIIWVAVSETWSPLARPLISGSLTGGDFGVNAAGLRIGLVALAGICVMGALSRPHLRPAPKAIGWICGAFLIQFAILVLLGLFREEALELFHGLSDKDGAAIQNIIRNANAFALATPILAAVVIFRRSNLTPGILTAAIIIVASTVAFKAAGADSAIISPVAALAGVIVVFLMKDAGFKALFTGLASYVLAAPLIFKGIVTLIPASDINMPSSFKSRLWGWEMVLDKIDASPWIGHGLGASKSWQDTFADYPDKLAAAGAEWANHPIIPSHPHNMPLQIWAETGFIGAILTATALAMIGWTLPSPRTFSPRARYAIAGLIGAATVTFSVSYSAWNDAYWANLLLLAGVITILARDGAHQIETNT